MRYSLCFRAVGVACQIWPSQPSQTRTQKCVLRKCTPSSSIRLEIGWVRAQLASPIMIVRVSPTFLLLEETVAQRHCARAPTASDGQRSVERQHKTARDRCARAAMMRALLLMCTPMMQARRLYGIFPGDDYLQDYWGPVRFAFNETFHGAYAASFKMTEGACVSDLAQLDESVLPARFHGRVLPVGHCRTPDEILAEILDNGSPSDVTVVGAARAGVVTAALGFVSRSAASWREYSVPTGLATVFAATTGAAATASSARTATGAAAMPESATPAASVPSCLLTAFCCTFALYCLDRGARPPASARIASKAAGRMTGVYDDVW